MNGEDLIQQNDLEDFTPTPVVYKNLHDSSVCVFCNATSGRYLKAKDNSWTTIFTDIEQYCKTGNERLVNKILRFYDKTIRIPCNRIIQSGRCSSGVRPYPEIFGSTIRDHMKSFSYNNVMNEKLKALTQISRSMESSHIQGVDQDGNAILDQKNLDLYLKVIAAMAKLKN